MGNLKPPGSVKLFAGMFTADPVFFGLAENRLQAQFGPIDYRSPDFPFDHTGYYEREMGRGLIRRFVAFEQPISPEAIVETKLATNEIEQEFAEERDGLLCRRINIDPGYVHPAKVILATTKDWAHRIYLGHGIYAEVTLRYHKGRYAPWPWTYPDFADGTYAGVFETIRESSR